jgi:hypothetical protein
VWLPCVPPRKRIGTINATSAGAAGAAGVRPRPASPANPAAGPMRASSRGVKASVGPAIARCLRGIRRRRGLAVRKQAERCEGEAPVGPRARVMPRGSARAVSLPNRGRGGWSGARRLRGVRAAGVGEDGAHDRGVLHGGDDAQPAATAGAGQDIEIEHAAHQRGPSPLTQGAGGTGAGLELTPVGVRGRAAIADDPRPPARRIRWARKGSETSHRATPS